MVKILEKTTFAKYLSGNFTFIKYLFCLSFTYLGGHFLTIKILYRIENALTISC